MVVTKRFIKIAKRVIKDTVQRFSAADPVVYSAAIAFFTIFSLPSILFLVIWIGGSILDPQRMAEEVYMKVRERVGEEGARQIQTILEGGFEQGDTLFSSTLSILLLLFTATVVFNFIKKALNSIWNVKPKPRKGLLKFAIDRVLSLLLILALGILIVANLLLDSVIALFGDRVANELLGLTPYLIHFLNFITSYLLLTLIFGLLFKVLPDIRSPWKPIWVGAMITAFLFSLGKFIIARIVGGIDITTTYGAAGSLAALLLWVFYSSVTVLLGNIFTKIYFLHKGYQVRPTHNAVAIEVRELEKADRGEKAPPVVEKE
jgi:membrane protein